VTFPRIWVIPGNRPGDDAQVYALAEELRLPFETRKLVFNWRFWLSGKYMGASPISVERKLRERTLVPPWPDLIILVGRRAVPIARWVQRQSGGRTQLVYVGHPRVPSGTFDLVYTTRQYLTPTGPNIRLQPLAMSRYRETAHADEQEAAWLQALPRPHLLLMLGGKTRHWCIPPAYIAAVALRLARRARKAGGSLIVARSARTSQQALDAIEAALEQSECEWRVVRNEVPRFPVLLADCEELFPTADSISMISESVITGKPVGVVPIHATWQGRASLGREVDETSSKRDLRRFWNYVLDTKLAGTVDDPVASKTDNPVVAAAEEVRSLLEARFGKLPA
jgi:mitochondrial fission protein ELM1